MASSYRTLQTDIVGLNSECMVILERVGWGQFFERFTSHN
jgi:hypothetical protein